MATANGDLHSETAESFARDYVEDLFNNNKNLGAFEEETLDLNIKSKYDDIVVEEEQEEQAKENNVDNTATFTVETVSPVQYEAEEETVVQAPPEPGVDTFQVNGHVDDHHVEVEAEVEVVAHNGDLQNGVPEPGQVEFTSSPTPSSPEVLEPEVSEMRLQAEEPVVAAPIELGQQVFAEEEEEEADDVVAPIPTNRGKAAQSEDELAELQFKKLGLSKNWWDSKRNESESQKDDGQVPDKFRTIKQNIRKGNTRSLMARFEKLTE